MSRVESHPSYLVRGILAEGDYGVLSAEFKVGKTWAVGDLAVSVASGTPWLNSYPIEAPGPVLLFAGEGGRRKLVRRVQAVCVARHIDAQKLDVHVCLRVPHFDEASHMRGVREEAERLRPKLVLIDPLYLAAQNAQSFNMFDMGRHLERIQHICQDAGSSLLITHHWNLTGKGTGARRMAGAGAEAWGRVLISMAVEKETIEPVTTASLTILRLEFQGDELGRHYGRVQRRVWVDDPQDLGSSLHYEVTGLDVDSAERVDASDGQRPAVRSVKDVLDAAESSMTVDAVQSALAAHGMRYKRRTIQDALAKLVISGEAVKEDDSGAGTRGRWRTAQIVDIDEMEHRA